MADDVEVAEVRSNVDRLSARRIHEGVAEMASHTVAEAADFLRATVPRGETLGLMHAVGHDEALEVGDMVLARVGVHPVHDAVTSFFSPVTRETVVPGTQDASQYPRFVDQGTGIFGVLHRPIEARRASMMRFPNAEGILIFRREVAGQRPAHFMEHTYVSMHLFLRASWERFRALMDRMGAEARADL